MIDLCGISPTSVEAINVWDEVKTHPLIVRLFEDLDAWEEKCVNSHKSASNPYHKLSFLADVGFDDEDPRIQRILQTIKKHKNNEGIFELPMTISIAKNEPSKKVFSWGLCDAPVVLHSVAKLERTITKETKTAMDRLISLSKENGWPCVVSEEYGKFRGPGRKDDPCPYATLVMLKMMSISPMMASSMEASRGVDCLLGLWEESQDRHPYMFYMGTDFRKLKAPLIWYDLLHVVDVLSHFKQALDDDRYQRMVRLLIEKADEEGLYTCESIWKAWESWDFGQKSIPSSWVTFLVERIKKQSQKEGNPL